MNHTEGHNCVIHPPDWFCDSFLKVSGHNVVHLQKCILTEVHLGVLMKSFGKLGALLPHSDCPVVPLGQVVCTSTAHGETLKT